MKWERGHLKDWDAGTLTVTHLHPCILYMAEHSKPVKTHLSVMKR